jgi:hypothetical protein
MEDDAVIINDKDDRNGKEVYTKVVRAGKRTYFFDVKATRKDDYYLTITESKKRLGKEGKVFYEKHKIFLYKEDFEKFADGLKDAIGFIAEGKAPAAEVTSIPDPGEYNAGTSGPASSETIAAGEFTNVNFDDLGKE